MKRNVLLDTSIASKCEDIMFNTSEIQCYSVYHCGVVKPPTNWKNANVCGHFVVIREGTTAKLEIKLVYSTQNSDAGSEAKQLATLMME